MSESGNESPAIKVQFFNRTLCMKRISKFIPNNQRNFGKNFEIRFDTKNCYLFLQHNAIFKLIINDFFVELIFEIVILNRSREIIQLISDLEIMRVEK